MTAAPFTVRQSKALYPQWEIVGPSVCPAGWGVYPSQFDAERAANRLWDAYVIGRHHARATADA